MRQGDGPGELSLVRETHPESYTLLHEVMSVLMEVSTWWRCYPWVGRLNLEGEVGAG